MSTRAVLRALLALLVGTMLLGGFSTDGAAQDWSLAPTVDGLAA